MVAIYKGRCVFLQGETCKMVGCDQYTYNLGEIESMPRCIIVHGNRAMLIDRYDMLTKRDAELQDMVELWLREVHLLELAELEGCCG